MCYWKEMFTPSFENKVNLKISSSSQEEKNVCYKKNTTCMYLLIRLFNQDAFDLNIIVLYCSLEELISLRFNSPWISNSPWLQSRMVL